MWNDIHRNAKIFAFPMYFVFGYIGIAYVRVVPMYLSPWFQRVIHRKSQSRPRSDVSGTLNSGPNTSESRIHRSLRCIVINFPRGRVLPAGAHPATTQPRAPLKTNKKPHPVSGGATLIRIIQSTTTTGKFNRQIQPPNPIDQFNCLLISIFAEMSVKHVEIHLEFLAVLLRNILQNHT